MTMGFRGGGDVAGMGTCELDATGASVSLGLYGGGGRGSGSGFATRFSNAAAFGERATAGGDRGMAGVGGGS